ncbi:RICIN domain-containing protein [Dictyobacter arantiisoli]|uniref:Ricin B lectin domain-containing protein n=1 Tax=Dictyobacter arantiisoli TaxID=2014874 RepID=A0A5A5T6U2_9CHLR|nr:RICIN domain-containing protein [Dictyobacter arantiisoli]GCF07122.1 hypothetical protein KDI_06860 [Dictyobacter arantiisoli]
MTMERREFLKRGLLTAGGLALIGHEITFSRVAHAATGGFYTPNLSPLQPASFYRLPPGSIKAQGWLANQLHLQLNGLNGQMTQVSSFLQYSSTGWINPDQIGWEEVPYWLRGYGDLAYVTGDTTALATTKQWINGILATQQSDGFFGPSSLRTSLNGGPDFWPHMPMLQALRSFQEYTNDTRIIPFLTKYFQLQNAQSSSVFSQGWGYYRWADNIDSIYWLYNRTGASWLLDLVKKIHQNSANYMNNLPTLHNVNLAQGFREPAQYGVLIGGSQYTSATYQNYNTIMGTYGQFPGGGFAGDEHARPGYSDPRQGFETCGIVEFMQSHELLTRITGDPIWADRTENLAFNSLPAAFDPQQKTTHYITSANSIQLDNVQKNEGQFDNTFAMQAYIKGIVQYRCCPHNYGQGWPFFTEELWLATPDKGICASLYAPSTVTARVGDGTGVTFVEQTDYPFSDTIILTLSTPTSQTFPLYLRIPGWCQNPVLKINGQNTAGKAGPSYVTINRTWANGDTVTLQLPMQTGIQTWANNHHAVSVNYGPLTFSLQIGANFSRFNNSTDQWPEYQVYPTTPWNYGLVLNTSNPTQSFTVNKSSGALAANPFTQQTVPITMQVQAQQIVNWQADNQNVVTPLQDSPVLSNAPTQTITLIPMGAARLRISAIPTIGTGSGAHTWLAPGTGSYFRIQNQNSGKVLGVSNMSTADSAQVVQFTDNGTSDHLWLLIDNGNGYFRIQNQNSGKVLGVSNMSTADSAQVVQFTDNGTPDHLWEFIPDANGYFRIQNQNSNKVLSVSTMSTADNAQVVQFTDNGSSDHLWRLRYDSSHFFRIQNQNSGKVLGVSNMSIADSAQVVQFTDNGTSDHRWCFL